MGDGTGEPREGLAILRPVTVIRPLRLFLDTNHLVNLTHLRQGRTLRGVHLDERAEAYRTIDEWMLTGRCVPVFCETMAYEWVRQKDPNAPGQIAAIFDTAMCAKRVLADPLIFIVEAMKECQRVAPGLGFPNCEVVGDFDPNRALIGWFNTHWPEKNEAPTVAWKRVRFDDNRRVAFAVEAVAEEVRRNDLRDVALAGELHRLKQTRATQRELGASDAILQKVRRGWLKTALLLDQVLRSMDPAVDTEAILARVRLEACPALLLSVDAYWAYAKANASPKDGDFVDLTMFAVLPYVDVALIENRMHDFVRQVRKTEYADRVFRDPVQLVASVSARI